MPSSGSKPTGRTQRRSSNAGSRSVGELARATPSVLLRINSYSAKTCCACPLRKNRSDSIGQLPEGHLLAEALQLEPQHGHGLGSCTRCCGAANGRPARLAAVSSIGQSVVG